MSFVFFAARQRGQSSGGRVRAEEAGEETDDPFGDGFPGASSDRGRNIRREVLLHCQTGHILRKVSFLWHLRAHRRKSL